MLIGLRFRGTAARLKLLNLHHPDLSVERLQAMGERYLPTEFARAARSGEDLDDPYTIWELLEIDAVVVLEDLNGKQYRVAISVFEREHLAYRRTKRAQTDLWREIRADLGIDRHWVFSGSPKHFPSDLEWVDILYSQIDRPSGWSDCRLIDI